MAHPQTDLPPAEEHSEFVQFWNEALGPKFNRFRHILVGGLTHHSEAVFPKLPVRGGDDVVDVGCGWGDTAMKLARIVGPKGSVSFGQRGRTCSETLRQVSPAWARSG